MLPWLQPAYEQLLEAQRAGRLPQALLIHEAPGTGGEILARHFAQLLLCRAQPPACGECSQCRRVQSGEHPDFVFVPPDPELKSGQITVDQVRALTQQLSLSSYEGRGSCVVLTPAHALNRNAANALLKTLEEPRRDAHLLLVSSAPSLLPATLRSRCQKLVLPAPSRTAALAWLKAQQPQHAAQWDAVLDVLGVAPLEALEGNVAQLLGFRGDAAQLLEDAGRGRIDVVRLAEAWAKDDLSLRLRCIENYLTNRILAMRPGARLQTGTLDINIAPALRLLDDLRELRYLQSAPLNKPLALERHLWLWNKAAVAG
jgi:DNA polymerase III subunit delta'